MRIKILTIILLCNLTLNAQGIEFFKGTYPEAKILAQKSNKKIFVDAYTTWCGPCKKMVKETFTDPKVREYFKQNFIALQLDAENESESEFFKDYTATAFPSLFWLDDKGDLLDMHVGFLDATGFLQWTKTASDKNLSAEYESLKRRWESDKRDYNLFKEYQKMISKVKPQLSKGIAEEYILGLTEEEQLSIDTYTVLQSFMRIPGDNIFFNTLIKNWDQYMEKSENPEDSWSRLYSSLVRLAAIYQNNKDTEAYNKHINLIKNLNFDHKDLFLESIQLENLIFDEKYSEAIDEMIKMTDKYSHKTFLYDNYYYTLILSGYFLREKANLKHAEKLIEFARKNAKIKATQKSMLYLATAYAYKKDYKTAYEYLASLGFYPQPALSNALYDKLNLPIPKNEFPW